MAAGRGARRHAVVAAVALVAGGALAGRKVCIIHRTHEECASKLCTTTNVFCAQYGHLAGHMYPASLVADLIKLATSNVGCRYCGVPLCNLPEDALLYAADIAFARSLHSGNHLLWTEDPALPDIVSAKQRYDENLDTAPDPIVINNPCASLHLWTHDLGSTAFHVAGTATQGCQACLAS